MPRGHPEQPPAVRSRGSRKKTGPMQAVTSRDSFSLDSFRIVRGDYANARYSLLPARNSLRQSGQPAPPYLDAAETIRSFAELSESHHGASGPARPPVRDLTFGAPEHQCGVQTSESKSIRKRKAQVRGTRGIGHYIQRACRVRFCEVRGRGH